MIKNKLMNNEQENKIVEYESNGQKVKLWDISTNCK